MYIVYVCKDQLHQSNKINSNLPYEMNECVVVETSITYKMKECVVVETSITV